jgi:hypothetical protein
MKIPKAVPSVSPGWVYAVGWFGCGGRAAWSAVIEVAITISCNRR